MLGYLAGCTGKGTGPSNTSPLIETLYVNDCQSLIAFEGQSTTPKSIYVAPEDWEITSFSCSPDGDAKYFILTKYDAEQWKVQTSLSRLELHGQTVELRGFTTCSDCEGAYGYRDINLAPNGRFLAIDGIGYEWSNLHVFDLLQEQMLDLHCSGRYDYTSFLVWHPSQNRVFGQSGHTLIENDIESMECRELPTPNIRDYLTEAELLQEGFLGDRVDYGNLIRERWPAYVSWHPGGWHFAFERDDSLYLFNMSDSSEVLLYGGNFDCYGQHFKVVWGNLRDDDPDPPDFGDRDIIVNLDSTMFDSVGPLNDSIAYVIASSGPVSNLKCQWGESFWSSQYLLRGTAPVEKFHIAEIDYLLWAFALDLTPEFWFLTIHYDDFHRLTDSAFVANYRDSVVAYWTAIEMFRDFRYPPALADKQELYINLVEQDYRFESALAAYLEDHDQTAFADSVETLRPEINPTFMDTIRTWLDEFDYGDRSGFSRAYVALHNRYFNYYGQVMVGHMEAAMSAYQIEPFYDDWFRAQVMKRNPRVTEGYLKRKIYER